MLPPRPGSPPYPSSPGVIRRSRPPLPRTNPMRNPRRNEPNSPPTMRANSQNEPTGIWETHARESEYRDPRAFERASGSRPRNEPNSPADDASSFTKRTHRYLGNSRKGIRISRSSCLRASLQQPPTKRTQFPRRRCEQNHKTNPPLSGEVRETNPVVRSEASIRSFRLSHTTPPRAGYNHGGNDRGDQEKRHGL